MAPRLGEGFDQEQATAAFVRDSLRGRCEAEMDLRGAVWRKSARSGDDGGECVQVAVDQPGLVAVRDSKRSAGPVLTCGCSEWDVFLRAVKEGFLRFS